MEADTEQTLKGVSDRYELRDVIGSGSSATVWRAFDQALGRTVAVKMLTGAIGQDPSVLKRFHREARHIASLSHPNIVKVFDVAVVGDSSFCVLEYIDGPSLDRVLRQLPVLGPNPTADLAVGVLAGLGHAHARGVVHRDVKPGNLLLSTVGTEPVVRVADFGIARGTEDTMELTAQGMFIGTPSYASPEQLSGRTVGPASDLYSLGCVLYRCISGHLPFEGADVERLALQHRFADLEPLRSVRPDVPEGMAHAIERALRKDPEDRFESAEEMSRAFVPWARDEIRSTVSRLRADWPMLGSVADGAGRHGTQAQGEVDTAEAFVGDGTGTTGSPIVAPGTRAESPIKRPLIFGAVALTAMLAGILGWRVLGGSTGPSVETSVAIASGGTLRPGQSISSTNGQFVLTMQEDGNLVEYHRQSRAPIWESASSGNFGAYAVMQSDGDFVVYPPGESSPPPGVPTPALWSTGTFGHPGSSVELLSDGSTVVIGPRHGSILWTSRPGVHP